jgi:hypothetical protein
MNNLIEESRNKGGAVKWLSVFVLAAAMVPQVYKLSIPVPEMIDLLYSDDSFYCYKTALNIRNGLGSTFDTINITNGYHPLWMLICVGLAFITTDIYAYFYTVLTANLLLVFLVALLLLRMFRRSLGFLFSAVLVFLLNWQWKSAGAIFSGLETPLYLLFVLLSIEMMVKITWREKKKLLVLGVLLGLTFLARTSFILFAPVFAGYLTYRFFKDRSVNLLGNTIFVLVPILIITVPYLIYNFKMTGHFEQISGLIKNLWNYGAFESTGHFTDTLYNFAQKAPIILQPKWLTIIPGVLFCSCVAVAIKKRPLCSFLKNDRVILLTVFALVSAGYYFVSFGKATRLWHLAPALMVFDILFVHALKALCDYLRGKRIARIFVSLMITAMIANCFFHVVIYRYKFPPTPELDTMTTWIKNNLPKDAKIGVWNAGYIGYFSERKIINLDGFINSIELYDYYREGKGVWKYIVDKKIDYIGDCYSKYPPMPMKSVLKSQLKEVYHSRELLVAEGEYGKPIDWYVWQVEYED